MSSSSQHIPPLLLHAQQQFQPQQEPQLMPLPQGYQQSFPPEQSIPKVQTIDPNPVPAKKLAIKLENPQDQVTEADLVSKFHATVTTAIASVTGTKNALKNPAVLANVSGGLAASLSLLSLEQNHLAVKPEEASTTTSKTSVLTEELLLEVLTLLKHTFSRLILPGIDPNYTTNTAGNTTATVAATKTKAGKAQKRSKKGKATESPDGTSDEMPVASVPDSSRPRKRGRPPLVAVEESALSGLIVQSCMILDSFCSYVDQYVVSEPILHMLVSASLSAVFSGGRALEALQMGAIRVLVAVASRSTSQRDSLVGDVILNISQYSGATAALKLFKVVRSDGQPAAINVVSALVLALIQSCGTRERGWADSVKYSILRPYKSSIICAKKMVMSLIQQLAGSSSSASSSSSSSGSSSLSSAAAKPFLPYFVEDVLSVFNTPEWPSAELVLHLLVSGLIHLQPPPRGAAIDILGTIGARIKAESDPVELLPPVDAGNSCCCRCRALLDPAMGVVLKCSDCGRSFHIECVARATVPGILSASWICADCATVRSIRAEFVNITSASSNVAAGNRSDYVSTTPVKKKRKRVDDEDGKESLDGTTMHDTNETASNCAGGDYEYVLDDSVNGGESHERRVKSFNFVHKQLIHNYLASESVKTGSVFCEDARHFLISKWANELFQETTASSSSSSPSSSPQSPQSPPTSSPPSTPPPPPSSPFPSTQPAQTCLRDPIKQFYEGIWELSTRVKWDRRTLSRDSVLRAVRIVGADHGVMRSFDAVLACVLKLLCDSQATVRSRAVRALGKIVCTAHDLLASSALVQSAIQMRLIDTAVSVRQQAVDLVGNLITQRLVGKKALPLYFDAIVSRVSDTGISVRKRAIGILEGISLSKEIADASPELVLNACKCLARRVVADDESIKAMILETFKALWFSPVDGPSPAVMRKRAEQIVGVVSVSYAADRGEWLQLLFASVMRVPPPSTSSAGVITTSIREANAGTLVCEQLCEAFMNLLVSSETRLAQGSSGAEAHRLQSVMAWTLCSLRLMCGVAPNLLCKHVLNLVPYMVPQGAPTQEKDEIACSVMAIVEATFPLMQGIQDSVLNNTESNLASILTKRPPASFNVVRAAARCLGVIVTRVKPNPQLMTALFEHFHALAAAAFEPRKNATAPDVLSVYTLGYLCQSYDYDCAGGVPSRGIAAGGVASAILGLYTSTPPGGSNNMLLEARRLQGYGAALGRWPALANDTATTALFSWALRSGDGAAQPVFQEAALVVITELLRSKVELIGDEERSGPLALAGTLLARNHSGAVFGLVVNSAEARVRMAAVGVVDLIARQGVVDPGLAVPSLVAMLSSPPNASKAYGTLSYILKKYLNSLGSRLAEGIALSYSVQVRAPGSVAHAVLWPKGSPSATNPGTVDASGGSADGSRVSPHILVGRLFSLVKGKAARTAFINTLLRPLESIVEDPTASASADPRFLAYVAEVVAFLPLETQDEVHLICAKAIFALLHRGNEAMDTLKKAIASQAQSQSLSSLSSESQSTASLSSLESSSPSSSSSDRIDADGLKKPLMLTFTVSLFATLKEFMRKVYGNAAKLSSLATDSPSSLKSLGGMASTALPQSASKEGGSKLSVSVETFPFDRDISGKPSIFCEQLKLLGSPAELRAFFKSQLVGDDAYNESVLEEVKKYNKSGRRGGGGGGGRKKGSVNKDGGE